MSKVIRLEPAELREFWEHEDSDFTPWVASEDGLAWLGDQLGLNLVDGDRQVPAGPFKADILCRDESIRGQPVNVVIENYLKPLDHDHIGKLLTYAAELNAEILVWITPAIGAQHRKTVEWLNQHFDSIRCFVVEVSLARIDPTKIDSDTFVPSLNVVSKPDDWEDRPTRSSGRSTRPITDLETQHLEYWTKFEEDFGEYSTGLNMRKPMALGQMGFSIGKAGITIQAARLKSTRSLRIGLELRGRSRDSYFRALFEDRATVEEEIGTQLEWIEGDPSCSIQLTVDKDPTDISDWDVQIEWMCENLRDFNKVFTPRIRSIDLTKWQDQDTVSA